MRGRPSLGYGLLLAAIAAGTTWTALMAWRGFTGDRWEYLSPLVAVGLVVAVSGALLRWLGSPAVVTLAGQTVLATALVSNELGGHPLPTGATYDRIVNAVEAAFRSAETYAAPIPPEVPSIAPLLVIGGAVFFLLVDLLACTLRRVPVSGLALLAIYSVPAGLTDAGPGVVAFLLAATGFLALLHLDSREHLLKWGRPLGPEERNPWTDANPVVDAMRVGAGRIGVTAATCAVLLPPFLPALDLDLFGFGPGDGETDIEIRNPRTDLRGDLERKEDVPLVRFRTDDPEPGYLRVAVLNRFTGIEWSSGDRGVSDQDRPTGPLPEPEGLSPAVPRDTYEYELVATDEFDSTWLPTQFPASEVVAEGDWRFDPDTMDFIAVPEGLDTRGIEWSVTALDLQLGRTGEFFQDSPIDAVDDEFLEVPGGLPSIVRSEAVNATRGAVTDYEAALLLQEYFRSSGGFEYSLTRAPQGIGGDAFETFLSSSDPDGRTGYCEQFASAMAVMARMVGIPARVAVGFLEPAPLGDGEWEYSSHDLHAWPELFFEGAGWVRFEPTPSGRAESAPDYSTVPVDREDDNLPSNAPTSDEPSRGETAQPSEATPTVLPEAEQETDVTTEDGGVRWTTVVMVGALVLLGIGLVVLVALTPRTLRSRARNRRLAGAPEDAWDELRATATDLGLPWPAGRTPQEVGRVLVDHLGDRSDDHRPERPRTGPDVDPEASFALERVVAALEHARYARPGTTTPPPGLADDARTCCASLEAGVTRRAALRARWLPRSLWQRTPRTRTDHDDLVAV